MDVLGDRRVVCLHELLEAQQLSICVGGCLQEDELGVGVSMTLPAYAIILVPFT